MVTNQLYMGYSTGSSGTYNLSGGSLSVNGRESIGEIATGAFTQSGGTNSTPASPWAINPAAAALIP